MTRGTAMPLSWLRGDLQSVPAEEDTASQQPLRFHMGSCSGCRCCTFQGRREPRWGLLWKVPSF